VLLRSPVAAPLDASHARDELAEQPLWVDAVADWDTPVDRSLPFVCDTLTPLYYTPLFDELTPRQRLRYNQLSAVSFNELIVFFERGFSVALEALIGEAGLSDNNLRDRIDAFLADERRHGMMWRRLSGATTAAVGPEGETEIVRVGRPLARGLRALASRPRVFPVVVLVMLTLEEHSIEISRRCGRLPPGALEPHYAAAYHAHLMDEVRHVRVDRELLDLLIDPLPRWLRAINAALFRRFVRRLWLRPTAAAVRVIDALIREYPDLRPSRPLFVRALAALDANDGYRRMMFSPEALPLTFSLIGRYPQFNPDGKGGST
jgi:hypothetical protein